MLVAAGGRRYHAGMSRTEDLIEELLEPVHVVVVAQRILAAVAQRTRRLRFGPLVYTLSL